MALRQEVALQLAEKKGQQAIARARNVSGGFWVKFFSYWAMINCCGADCCITCDQRNRVMALKDIEDGDGWCMKFLKSCCCSQCAQCQHARQLKATEGATQSLGSPPPPGALAPPVVAQPLLLF